MLIYTGTIKDFNQSVLMGDIADRIEKEFRSKRIPFGQDKEYRSWDNSLRAMSLVLNDNEIDENIRVAIEYQIPTTGKRVDFIVSGFDEVNIPTAVIIELKQWETAEKTSREDLVTTFVASAVRSVTHPSYQAYSYAKTIENYCEYVEKYQVNLIPCAYLHNFKENYRDHLDNELYKTAIELAPIFLKIDALKLRSFIKTHVKKCDNGELLYGIENGKIRPSKALQDALVLMMDGNEEFVMIDEQKVVYSTILRLVELSQKNNKKYTVIVEGGPGTGKSVLAIQLLVELRDKLVNYVTKNAAPRNVYFQKLRQEKYKLSYVKNLFKSSGAYVNTKKNTYDCLLVDEAHRLNEKSGLFANLGENQIKEIINASKVSVFFIDEDQIVTSKDFGSIKEIIKCAKELNSEVLGGEEYKLTSQFRCNGSDGYLAFLDHILEIRETANYDGFTNDYKFEVYDNPTLMREDLRNLNRINNKARMIAGYCYDWITQKNKDENIYDISLDYDFNAKWNFNTTNTWAIDEDSFDEVGCIHTSQGLEFDYVGVIIGKDLIFRNGHVLTDPYKRAKTDQSLRGLKKDKDAQLIDRIIRNTYKTLLTRGQKGCFVYCEDRELAEYIKEMASK